MAHQRRAAGVLFRISGYRLLAGNIHPDRHVSSDVARRAVMLLLLCTPALLVGCGAEVRSPTVIFLDGAGYFGSSSRVRAGLEAAGFRGGFETFVWSSGLGPGPDHLMVSRNRAKSKALAGKICEIHSAHPDGRITLPGLSAGTALIVFALEQLPDDVMVDGVVLFSSSVSAMHDLSEAMRHVRGRLYATCSRTDGILRTIAVNADGQPGAPAGRFGFAMPPNVVDRDAYERVVNLNWRPAYAGFGWRGGHVGVTGRRFIETVIAPRVMSNVRHPLDVSVAERARLTSGKKEQVP